MKPTSCVFAFLFVLAVSTRPALGDQRSDVEKRLQKAFGGQVLIIRNFYTDSKLGYNSKGEIIAGGKPGPWEKAEIEVVKVKLKRDTLVFEGPRVNTVYDKEQQDLTNVRQDEKVQIEIQLDSDQPHDQYLAQIIGEIFLTKQDKLEDLVSPEWKLILQEQQRLDKLAEHPLKVGNGVTPPKPKPHKVVDPEYSDYARAQRIEGTVVLWMVVDAEGRPRRIRIVKTLGYGLDEKAVDAVKRWRFDPATKDSQPVPVQLNVEISFRLR